MLKWLKNLFKHKEQVCAICNDDPQICALYSATECGSIMKDKD